MTNANPRKLFLNLCVRELARTKQFFTKLGFTYNAQFTDDKAACMVVSDEAFVMLLERPFFETFTKKSICDTSTHTEAFIAISCPTRESVDEIVHAAIAAGGTHAMPAQDHGFMYGWSFYDLDGHHWEVMWMDPKTLTS